MSATEQRDHRPAYALNHRCPVIQSLNRTQIHRQDSGTLGLWHSEILKFLSMHFASTLAVNPNLQCVGALTTDVQANRAMEVDSRVEELQDVWGQRLHVLANGSFL